MADGGSHARGGAGSARPEAREDLKMADEAE